MRRRWTKRDPKAVWCTCLHHSTKHAHKGYKRLYGFIERTIRGECEVVGKDGVRCPCRAIVWITRAHRDSLKARREAN